MKYFPINKILENINIFKLKSSLFARIKMNGYGLQLRKKPVAGRPPLPPPAPGFGDEDDDDVEKEIAWQAAMKRSKI